MVQPTPQILAYIEALYANKELNRTDYTDITKPAEGGTVIDDDVARFFSLIMMIKRPKHILEIGTSVGYSTVSMAKIIQDFGGKITTIELDEITAKTAQENFERYNVSQNVEILVGDAKEILPKLSQRFDYIFMDVGDKTLYKALTDSCVEKLNSGGIFVAEDSLFGYFVNDSDADETIKSLNEFNQGIAIHPDLDSTLLPIGDGVTFAVKK